MSETVAEVMVRLVKAVQRMLGHASAAMTLDTYADLFDDDLDAVSTALSEARTRSIYATEQAPIVLPPAPPGIGI